MRIVVAVCVLMSLLSVSACSIQAKSEPLQVLVHVNDDLPIEDRADMAVWVVSMELERLGLPQDTNLDNIKKFVFMVKQAESSGKRRATSVANAMSFYQFKPESVKTAVNRFERWTQHHNLPFPEWAEDLRQHPKDIYGLRDSLQAMLMMVNIVEQRGSDSKLLELIDGDAKAAKELYYVYHHTAPDDQTVALIDQLFPKYFSGS